MSSVRAQTMLLVTFFLSCLLLLAQGQTTATPSRHVDGNAIDQGIAYALMLVALFVTYFLHYYNCTY
ncbi:Arabinogalactan peptide 22 [Rhynchospora pubera]|uniref:Arabinogalactan peptide 22 n=1 Tax=Rhynchospora pubera TaxID=906938 RepID=A0AAV8HTE4_9POAL|nr:Arabinogalactan peptide 22 [Rhynchospora pubera]